MEGTKWLKPSDSVSRYTVTARVDTARDHVRDADRDSRHNETQEWWRRRRRPPCMPLFDPAPHPHMTRAWGPHRPFAVITRSPPDAQRKAPPRLPMSTTVSMIWRATTSPARRYRAAAIPRQGSGPASLLPPYRVTETARPGDKFVAASQASTGGARYHPKVELLSWVGGSIGDPPHRTPPQGGCPVWRR
jgi:hypothetical protein